MSEGLIYEKFWTTANAEYGRFWEKRKPKPEQDIVPAPQPDIMSTIQSPKMLTATDYRPQSGVNDSRAPPVDTHVTDQTRDEYREAALNADMQRGHEHRPRTKQYTDEDLLNEVDFVGRAAKMAKSGDSAPDFPPTLPAVQYMEKVQSRFWNAMTDN